MNLKAIVQICGNEESSIIEFFRSVGLSRTIVMCKGCNKVLREVKYKRTIDGLAFRCYKIDWIR